MTAEEFIFSHASDGLELKVKNWTGTFIYNTKGPAYPEKSTKDGRKRLSLNLRDRDKGLLVLVDEVIRIRTPQGRMWRGGLVLV